MDHGLRDGQRTMPRGPPHKVHLAPMGRYNYPIHSKLEDSGRAPLWWAAKLQALQEQDSLKSEGLGEKKPGICLPTWRLRISVKT